MKRRLRVTAQLFVDVDNPAFVDGAVRHRCILSHGESTRNCKGLRQINDIRSAMQQTGVTNIWGSGANGTEQ